MKLAIIVITITLVLGLILFIYLKSTSKKGKEELSQAQKTANEFVNVRDIQDKFLYTIDGHVISYLNITPISIDLLSNREKEQLVKTLTAELSAERKAIKFLAVSTPVDITDLMRDYSQMLLQADQKQKELLRNEISVLNDFALSGEVVERQFYIMIWEKYKNGIEKDLLKRAEELKSRFGNIETKILEEKEICRLCNLINNPAYIQIEDSGTATRRTMPILDKEEDNHGEEI